MSDPFAKLDIPVPAPDAPSPIKIKHMREFVRVYARDLAMMVVLGETEEWEANLEITVAIIERGDRIEATGEQKLAARDAEWAACIEHARATVERMRSVLRQLAWERAPGREMLAAAERILCEASAYAHKESVTELARQVALSTVRGGGRVAR